MRLWGVTLMAAEHWGYGSEEKPSWCSGFFFQ